jgi:hypothetical protein
VPKQLRGAPAGGGGSSSWVVQINFITDKIFFILPSPHNPRQRPSEEDWGAVWVSREDILLVLVTQLFIVANTDMCRI